MARLLYWSVAVGLVCNPATAEDFEAGIVFAKRGEQELKLDIAVPEGGVMRPAVLCIHGGGWRAGQRSSYHRLCRTAAQSGYVAATIDYRLTDVAPWPAQIEDVRAALRWLIEHAERFRIDPERIAVLGESAGGHLALMLGAMPAESDNHRRIRAIVNFYGPTDLQEVKAFEHIRGMVESLVGGPLEQSEKVLKEVSPVVHVDRTDPPVLTFHGTEDKLVPIAQAEQLHSALTKVAVPNQLKPLVGVGHGIGGNWQLVHERLHGFLSSYLTGGGMALVAHEDFNSGTERWEATDRSAWKLVNRGGRSWYALIKKRSSYEPKVRSPYNISLLRDYNVSDFVLDVDLRSTNELYGHQDLCLFFGHQDPSHFYYVHLGRAADAHANSIFLVNGKPRVSIAAKRTDGTDWSRGWHRARVRREVATGRIEVFFDDMTTPIMVATDKTFLSGRVGVGSFDDTGDFDSIRLWGTRVAE